MRQRVGIARAFALSPKMLLLDEPFGMLDSLTRMELQQVLMDSGGAIKKTALMVTHDVDEALFLADRIVMMTNGPEAEVGEILDVHFPAAARTQGRAGTSGLLPPAGTADRISSKCARTESRSSRRVQRPSTQSSAIHPTPSLRFKQFAHRQRRATRVASTPQL